MDTREAQILLAFQNHSYPDFIARARKKSRFIRILGPLIGRFAMRVLAADTPYQGENSITAGATLWDDLKAAYGMDDSMLRPVPGRASSGSVTEPVENTG